MRSVPLLIVCFLFFGVLYRCFDVLHHARFHHEPHINQYILKTYGGYATEGESLADDDSMSFHPPTEVTLKGAVYTDKNLFHSHPFAIGSIPIVALSLSFLLRRKGAAVREQWAGVSVVMAISVISCAILMI